MTLKCRAVRSRLSAFLDRDLPHAEAQAVAVHLETCAPCAREWRSLGATVDLLAELPRVALCESIAALVQDRLETETRTPGLALLFRPTLMARPLLLRSLIPAACLVVSVLAGALALDRDSRVPVAARARDSVASLPDPSGTESNPFLPSSGVSAPRVREGGALSESLAGIGEGTLFLETVVARDGSVAAVTLLHGDREQARPLVEALRHQRFEPGRFHGRPVAVSVYRLFSGMEVREPVTD